MDRWVVVLQKVSRMATLYWQSRTKEWALFNLLHKPNQPVALFDNSGFDEVIGLRPAQKESTNYMLTQSERNGETIKASGECR